MTENQYSLVKKYLHWVSTHWIDIHHGSPHIDYFVAKTQLWQKNHGVEHTIAIIKNIRLHVIRYLASNPLMKSQINLGLNKKGLPKKLGPLMSLVLSGDPKERRLLLTILNISRCFPERLYKEDTTSITSPWKGEEPNWGNMGYEVYQAITLLGLPTQSSPPQWRDYHLSLKKGPNGQATLSSITDLVYIDDESIQDLTTLGGDTFAQQLKALKRMLDPKLWVSKFNPKTKITGNGRKLVSIPDKEAKTRVIAIFDYWSQDALKPLHDTIMRFLKNLKADCTYDQTKAIPVKSPGHKYYSFDLKSATDRFPIGFQEMVLGVIYNSTYAAAWRRVMTSKAFTNPWGEPLKYNKGQPMGALSSWAVFTLSHHIVVYIAALRCGIQSNHDKYYRLLGDDIVILHNGIATEYQKILKGFEVDISSHKTLISDNMCEFAKKLYEGGTDISGIQYSWILNKTFYWTITEELYGIIDKLSLSSHVVGPRGVAQLLTLLGLPIRFKSHIKRMFMLPRSDESEQVVNYKLIQLFSELDLPYGCNFRDHSKIKVVKDIMADMVCKKLEDSLRPIANEIGDLRKLAAECTRTIDTSVPQEVSTNTLIRYIPPVKLGMDMLTKGKNILSQIVDQDYSMDDLLGHLGSNILMSPTRVFHEKESIRIYHDRADLLKRMVQYSKLYSGLLKEASDKDTSEEAQSRLFQKQWSVLPSSRRNTVMVGYPKV